MVGRTLSHFRIVAKVGEGGMGVVYRAEDERLRRSVALKVLPPDLVGNEERRLRFLREAQAAAAISHPNIATIYEVGEADGIVFIAMEYIEGETLRDRMGGRPMAIKEALRVATGIVDGLAQAHQAQVIHRDLKPDNVIVAVNGQVKILDFGLAKLLEESRAGEGGGASDAGRLRTISAEMTQAGKILGTAAYMSPEQARGQVVDARSDIFSFGTTLYEMATGRAPFEGKTPTDILTAIIRDQPARPSQINPGVPAELDRIIAECLEKDPQDRYQHTDQLAVDLRKLKRATDSGVQAVRTPSGGVAATRTGASRRFGAWANRHVALSAAAAVALLIAAGAGAWWGLRPAGRSHEGDRIIVADFDNRTGRPEFDRAIRDAFEERLGLSSFVQVIRGDDLKSLLDERTGTFGRIDRDTGDRLCAGGACAGLLTGSIASDGPGFRLEAALRRVGEVRPIVTLSAIAGGPDDLLAAIHRIVLDLRRSLGESPQAVAGTTPPTTRSLAAYEAYAMGMAVGLGRIDEQIGLFRRAITIDPKFVDAYSELATAAWNIGEFREWRRLTEDVLRLSDALPEKARLWNETNYLEARYDFETEIERLKTYQRLYPFDDLGPNALALLYDNIYEDHPAAEAAYRAAYRASPEAGNFWNLVSSLALPGKFAEAEQVVAEFRSRGGSESDAALALMVVALARGDYKSVLKEAERLQEKSPYFAFNAAYTRRDALLAAGRLTEAREAARTLARAAVDMHDVRGQQWAAVTQAWLSARRGENPAPLSEEQTKAARTSLLPVRGLATFSVEIAQVEPLARIVEEHRAFEKDNPSRFVREQLEFADGCLALIRGQAEKARQILEPITRTSLVVNRHHVMGRTYEVLELWSDAAREYEDVLDRPYGKWSLFLPAVWVLDQFRLAQVYERLGDTARARRWYERFLTDWKDADPDIPEVIEAHKRLAALDGSARTGGPAALPALPASGSSQPSR